MEILHRSGIPLVVVPQALDADDVAARIAAVVEALGLPEAGAALQAQVAGRLDAARRAAAPDVILMVDCGGDHAATRHGHGHG